MGGSEGRCGGLEGWHAPSPTLALSSKVVRVLIGKNQPSSVVQLDLVSSHSIGRPLNVAVVQGHDHAGPTPAFHGHVDLCAFLEAQLRFAPTLATAAFWEVCVRGCECWRPPGWSGWECCGDRIVSAAVCGGLDGSAVGIGSRRELRVVLNLPWRGRMNSPVSAGATTFSPPSRPPPAILTWYGPLPRSIVTTAGRQPDGDTTTSTSSPFLKRNGLRLAGSVRWVGAGGGVGWGVGCRDNCC